MVLVPLLAYDKQGNRLGYGKGYYDKFLPLCRKDCEKIGISFFEAEEELPEVHAADFNLDGILLASGLKHFS